MSNEPEQVGVVVVNDDTDQHGYWHCPLCGERAAKVGEKHGIKILYCTEHGDSSVLPTFFDTPAKAERRRQSSPSSQ